MKPHRQTEGFQTPARFLHEWHDTLHGTLASAHGNRDMEGGFNGVTVGSKHFVLAVACRSWREGEKFAVRGGGVAWRRFIR